MRHRLNQIRNKLAGIEKFPIKPQNISTEEHKQSNSIQEYNHKLRIETIIHQNKEI